MDEHCPRTIELSAWLDRELADAARARLEVHLAGCPACSAMLDELRQLRTELRALPGETLGFDLSELIRGRLEAERPRPVAAARRWPGWRRLFPIGAGAAAALSLGLFMGLALTAGSGAAFVPRIAAMAVFDPVAPGGLCIGLDACYAPRGMNGGLPK